MYRNVELFLLVFFTLSIEGINIPVCPFPNGEHPEFFPHEDCGKFYLCSNGTPYLINCPRGLHFDIKVNRCNWPHIARCRKSTAVTDSTETSEEDILEKCFANNSEEPVYYSDKDCSKYWICINGFAFVQYCSGGLYFNSTLKRCDLPENVVCEFETTPTTHPMPTSKTTDQFTTFSAQTCFVEVTSTTTEEISTADEDSTSEEIPATEETPTTEETATTENTPTSKETPTTEETTTEETTTTEESGPPETTQATELSTEFSSSTPLFTTTESDVTTEEDFDTTTDDDSIKTTPKDFRPSADSDEDDMAGFSEEEDTTTSRKAKTTTEESETSTRGAQRTTKEVQISTQKAETTTKDNHDTDEMVARICQNFPNDQFQASHPFDCSKYLFCDYGYVIIMDCQAGFWYDPLTRKCVNPNKTWCSIWLYEKEILLNQKNRQAYTISMIRNIHKRT